MEKQEYLENPLIKKLKRIIKATHYLKMQIKQQSQTDRRADARKKIMLGGLFVKAGLDYFHPHDPATLYGMLLYAKEKMEKKPEIASVWNEKGKELMIGK